QSRWRFGSARAAEYGCSDQDNGQPKKQTFHSYFLCQLALDLSQTDWLRCPVPGMFKVAMNYVNCICNERRDFVKGRLVVLGVLLAVTARAQDDPAESHASALEPGGHPFDLRPVTNDVPHLKVVVIT